MPSEAIPLYKSATQLDCVCFSNETIWNFANPIYRPNNKVLGTFIRAEATALTMIEAQTYDYVLSCHQLEHCANPIQALSEYFRVLKTNGEILLIVPNKNYTFDHNRPFTSFQHVLEDYRNKIGEDDLTHFGEIQHLHDLALDPGAPQTIKEFALRGLDNYSNRCFHHHVFSPSVVLGMLAHVGFIPIENENQDIHMIFTAYKE